MYLSATPSQLQVHNQADGWLYSLPNPGTRETQADCKSDLRCLYYDGIPERRKFVWPSVSCRAFLRRRASPACAWSPVSGALASSQHSPPSTAGLASWFRLPADRHEADGHVWHRLSIRCVRKCREFGGCQCAHCPSSQLAFAIARDACECSPHTAVAHQRALTIAHHPRLRLGSRVPGGLLHRKCSMRRRRRRRRPCVALGIHARCDPLDRNCGTHDSCHRHGRHRRSCMPRHHGLSHRGLVAPPRLWHPRPVSASAL